jgi:hypothetical protein
MTCIKCFSLYRQIVAIYCDLLFCASNILHKCKSQMQSQSSLSLTRFSDWYVLLYYGVQGDGYIFSKKLYALYGPV